MANILQSLRFTLIKSKFDILIHDRSLTAKLFQKVKHNWVGLEQFLEGNIVEVRFTRRLEPKKGYKPRRRILATRDFWLARRLAKMKGINLRVKKRKQKSYYKKHNMILVWDLLENDWRMISLDKWKIVDFVPLTENTKDIISDWYRKTNLKRVSESKKRTYHNS